MERKGGVTKNKDLGKLHHSPTNISQLVFFLPHANKILNPCHKKEAAKKNRAIPSNRLIQMMSRKSSECRTLPKRRAITNFADVMQMKKTPIKRSIVAKPPVRKAETESGPQMVNQ